MSKYYLFILTHLITIGLFGQFNQEKNGIVSSIDAKQEDYFSVAMQIWDFAEVGYQEEQSSALLQSELSKKGFKIEKGVAEIPTAFIASYGSGKPVIAILGEFDALPGVSQTAAPVREKREDVTSGHACGHHLFGAGSMAAAIEVKEWMQANKIQGTLILWNTCGRRGRRKSLYGKRWIIR